MENTINTVPYSPNTSAPLPNTGTSQDTRTIVTVLLLIFMFPIGFLLMWFWSKWKVWVKILISVPMIILVLVILPAIVLISVNPAKQFSRARDTRRTADVNTIVMAIKQYSVDNRDGVLDLDLPNAGTNPETISSANGYTKLCEALLPTYLSSLPVDPKINDGTPITSCEGDWNTGYMIGVKKNGEIEISAPETEVEGPIVSVSR